MSAAASPTGCAPWSSFRQEALRSVHLATAKLLVMSSVCAAVFLYLEGDAIVKFWTAGRLAYDPKVMLALLVQLGAQSFWSTSAVLMSATNNHRKIAVFVTASGVIGLLLGYALGRTAGIPGVIYGMAAADFFLCGYYVPRLACRHVGQRFMMFVLEVLGRSAAVLGMLVVLASVLAPLVTDLADFPRMIATAACLCALAGVMSYGIVLNSNERRQLHVRFTSARAAMAAYTLR